MTQKAVRKTILEDPIEIKVGKRVYKCKPCSVEGMIRISELIPDIELNKKADVVSEVLRIAKNCRFLGDIIATMVIRNTGIFVNLRRKMFGKRYLSVKTPSEMYVDFANLIGTKEIPDFFSLTTFLLETSLTKPTKKAKTTTASGL